MSLSLLFAINAVVAVLFGLGFVFAPNMLLAHYGVGVGAGGEFMTQICGAAFIGFGLVAWAMRRATAGAVRDGVLLGFLVGMVVGFVVALMGQLAGVTNALGWSTVALYGLFALGFGYYRFAASSTL